MSRVSDLAITPLPAFSDNYLWLLSRGGEAAVVDPGDSVPVQRALAERSLKLAAILVTHHHGDHVGGVMDLRATGATVYGPRGETIEGVDVGVAGGDRVEVLGVPFSVLDVPGHTAGHIAYFTDALDPPAVFCGDTLFACGCGRLFEGTPAQMLASLDRLAQLPGHTRVYCAHEYTLANIRFALAVEPGNAALRQRALDARTIRDRGEPTVPSTIELERATNPFMRSDADAVRQAAMDRAGAAAGDDRVATFAAIRAWKNEFR
ncbi:MAG TPA: hydroxyacylglutathione hydrolase [Burkholderiaceae bacterium]|nr:hydroxyacylglutathione hydrolase [Burkholderiaceae bacterium]HQR69724.1 hydroxyacylglutathione hydrolase [Burkholderiaceae bacterium]